MTREAWSNEHLDAMREVGDPPLDAIIERVAARGSMREVGAFLTTLVRGDNSLMVSADANLPPEIREYLVNGLDLPPWADPAKVKLGQEVFMRNGLIALAALLCASLPLCYAHKKGAQVLWYTQQLEDHTVRRVYKTAQIILDVMDPGGLDDRGSGVLSATKTRLFHAAMRALTLSQPSRAIPSENTGKTLAAAAGQSTWNPAWGVPINQEDSAFTLLVFSYVIVRTWRLAGIELSTEEIEAYLHCWNIVGYFLGVRDDLMAHTLDDAEYAFLRMQERQEEASMEGQKLTESLVQVLTQIIPSEDLARKIDQSLMRSMLGDKTCDVLGLPPPGPFDALMNVAYQGIRVWDELTCAVRDFLVGVTGGDGEKADGVATHLGEAVSRLFVAVIGRGEHGFDPGHIGKSATELLHATTAAGPAIASEVKPVFHADSSAGAKHSMTSKIGVHLAHALHTKGKGMTGGNAFAVPPKLAKAWGLELD